MNNLIEKDTNGIAVTPASLLEMAVSQNADIDKLEKLMALQERWEANEAKKSFIAAMSTFRSKCPGIERTENVNYTTKTGGTTSYRHATLAGAISQIKKLLSECGLSHSWRTYQDGGTVRVTCTVTHIGGHSESTALAASPDASGGKNSIQAIGSTVSYLERYTLFAILGLAATDQDDDGLSAEIERIDAEQQLSIRALLDELGPEVEFKFMEWLRRQKVESIEMIRADCFDATIKMLEGKRK